MYYAVKQAKLFPVRILLRNKKEEERKAHINA